MSALDLSRPCSPLIVYLTSLHKHQITANTRFCLEWQQHTVSIANKDRIRLLAVFTCRYARCTLASFRFRTAIEDFINQALWSNEFHVEAKGSDMEQRKQDMLVGFGVPATLDRIVN